MSNPSEILCFGEVIIRIARGPQWPSSSEAKLFLGGAEYNVAAALACWDEPAGLVTALPDNSVCDDIAAYIRGQGIATHFERVAGSRVGVFHIQLGLDMKNAGVDYDRGRSAFAELDPGAIDWDALLGGASWFHVSAITPALSENAFHSCLRALERARAAGVTTSLDLNYRAALWQDNVAPRTRIEPLLEYCDWVMGNPWSAEKLCGSPLELQPLEPGDVQSHVAQAEATAADLFNRWPGCRYVAQTFRFDYRDTGVEYFATLRDRERMYVSDKRRTESVVNKVGSGDCFMAGLIYGSRHGYAPQQTVDFAAAAAFGHFQEETDITRQSIADITSDITGRRIDGR